MNLLDKQTVLNRIIRQITSLFSSIWKLPALNALRSGKIYYFLAVILSLLLIDLLFPLPSLKPYSKVVYASDGTILAVNLTDDYKWRIKIHLDEVSPELVKAIIEKEDNWFRWHCGVNPVSVFRALFQNILGSRRISGASTITMQVARMMDPTERTYTHKILEMFRALQLELHYNKDEILEMYFNLLPYGGNIVGVKSASYIYFNRPPSKLSLSQSIVLTIIPNNPNRLRLDKNPVDLIKIRDKWIRNFTRKNIFTRQELKDAKEEPVISNRYPFNIRAPHFCRYIENKFNGSEIRTSLKPSIQLNSEQLLAGYIDRIKVKGISNGAVIVIDNKTNSVVGYCGSGNFNDTSSQGQVNGITALRSPGSALKPALYAMAFDNGILTPTMRLNDIPSVFNGFEPENFDQKFHGNVTAGYALINSLNVPAVELLQQAGYDNFISLLDKSGFSEVSKNKNTLGLSMIIGGCSVRLEQLTRFYTAFAHSGFLYNLNYLNDIAIDKNKAIKVFSPGSSYMIASILSSHERPDFPNDLLSQTNLPQIAWKTGTSFGKRDAWAIGFNPDYTIGVWLGNFDGRGASDLTGAVIAVPLLFDLFNSIDYKPNKVWFDKPDDLHERYVCSESGMLPSENCTNVEKDFYIDKSSPNKKCDLYKACWVDQKETMTYCSGCLPDSGYKTVYYPSYPPELTIWFLKNKVKCKMSPPHNPVCQSMHSGDGPVILSPVKNFEYYIEEGKSQQMMLQAASDPSVKQHFWYIDDKFYKKCRPGDKLFFSPNNGTTKILCLDDLGRESSMTIKTTYY
jgi:penicillin-binding protein 1C